MRVPRLRPAHPSDISAIHALWTEQSAFGARDSAPELDQLRRMFVEFDWIRRSRVAEGRRGLAGAILLADRQTVDGTVARLEAVARSQSLDAELLAWGIGAAREAGAAVVSVWRGRGHGHGLRELGFSLVRPFWRMDRPSLEDVPGASVPVPYRLVTATPGTLTAGDWASLYNRSFEGHWRHTEKTAEQWRRRLALPGADPGLALAALARDGAPVGLAVGSIKRYHDRRPQPVGIVETVGTVPGHRRQGVARALTVELIRRLRLRGGSSASLYVDGHNSDRAYDLYRQLGFGVGFEFEVWEQAA